MDQLETMEDSNTIRRGVTLTMSQVILRDLMDTMLRSMEQMTSPGEQMATVILTLTQIPFTTGMIKVMLTSAMHVVDMDVHCAVDMDTSTREDNLDIMVMDSRLALELDTLTPTLERNQDPHTTSMDMELEDATHRDGPMDMEADMVKDMERDMDLLTDGLNSMDMEKATQAQRDL